MNTKSLMKFFLLAGCLLGSQSYCDVVDCLNGCRGNACKTERDNAVGIGGALSLSKLSHANGVVTFQGQTGMDDFLIHLGLIPSEDSVEQYSIAFLNNSCSTEEFSVPLPEFKCWGWDQEVTLTIMGRNRQYTKTLRVPYLELAGKTAKWWGDKTQPIFGISLRAQYLGQNVDMLAQRDGNAWRNGFYYIGKNACRAISWTK